MKKHIGVGVLCVAVGALGASGCATESPGFNLNNRLTFATLTYPSNEDQVSRPPVQLDFQLYAATQLDVMGPWDAPRTIATCMSALDAWHIRALALVLHQGVLTSDGGSPASIVDGWALSAWTGLSAANLPEACKHVLASDSDDRLQLAWALAHVAQRVDEQARSSWLLSASEADVQRVFQAADDALERHAALIARSPEAPSPAHNNLPVLALSGGAANGAFSAGLLYELLSAREEALVALDAGPSSPMAQASRFKAVIGTSVGALLAELLDFSMLDDATFDPSQRTWLEQCVAASSQPQPPLTTAFTPSSPTSCNDRFAGWPGGAFPEVHIEKRPVMTCALRKLSHYFADADERELICVEPGSVARVLKLAGRPRTNFMRFDPMEKSAVSPLLEHFAQAMTNNDMTRVLSAVDTQQNVLIGLDERACSSADAGYVQSCRSSGVMASLVLPLFARPLSRISSGFSPRGECGIWFDGGLRSELSTLRALSFSRANVIIDANNTLFTDGSAPNHTQTCVDVTRCEHDRLRVLAFSNGRANGLPHNKPEGIDGVLFDGLDQFLDQQGPAELALAQALAMQREAEFVSLSRIGALPDFAGTASTIHRQLSPASIESRVQTLHVPGEVPSWVVVGAGYSFDPYVMRGLFIWGRKTMREELLRGLVGRLGWPQAMQEKMGAVIDAREDAQDIEAWVAAYRQPLCNDFFKWRNDEGRARIRSHELALCAEPDADDAPKYFMCRDGLDVGNGQFEKPVVGVTP